MKDEFLYKEVKRIEKMIQRKEAEIAEHKEHLDYLNGKKTATK